MLGIGEEIKVRDLVDIVAKSLGQRSISQRLVRIPVPSWFLKLVALPLEFLAGLINAKPLIDRNQIDFISFDWHFKIPEWQKKLWQPKIKFEQGIRGSHGGCEATWSLPVCRVEWTSGRSG